MARPKKKIDEEQVKQLAAINCSYSEMAAVLSCDPSLLTKRFSQAIKEGREIGKMSLKRKQFDVAMGGNVTMLIWLGKQLLDQREKYDPPPWKDQSLVQSKIKKLFKEFCETAGYPPPYPKQEEMRKFGIEEDGAHLILGSRGYGKTDYVVILGIAYKIYLDQDFTALLVTKSEERNASILREISSVCKANGILFEKENSTCIRVQGLRGKDHSVSSVTIGATSIRGRHPDLVIMDDPVTEEDVSEATRKRVQRVYNELTKLTPNILVIGQPVHKYDLYETLRPLLKKMEVPHGSIPELDHDLEAQRLAGVSEDSIQASYFLKVISESISPLDKVKYIDRYPPGDSIAFIDPSFEGGDYTALSIVRAHFDGIAVQGHVWKKAWNHCLDEMVHAMRTYSVKKLCFETNSLGDQPILMLREAVQGIGVVGKKSTKSKHSRIMNAGAYAHLIHLARTSDKTYIDQVVQYEYGAKYDDAPDSLASCLEWLGLIRGLKV